MRARRQSFAPHFFGRMIAFSVDACSLCCYSQSIRDPNRTGRLFSGGVRCSLPRGLTETAQQDITPFPIQTSVSSPCEFELETAIRMRGVGMWGLGLGIWG